MEVDNIMNLNSENINLIEDRTLCIYHAALHSIFKKVEDTDAKAKILGLHILLTEEFSNRGLNYDECLDNLDKFSETLFIKIDNTNKVWQLTEKKETEEDPDTKTGREQAEFVAEEKAKAAKKNSNDNLAEESDDGSAEEPAKEPAKELSEDEDDSTDLAKWTTKFINSLPDMAFAIVEPAYKKGDTEDKRARHLPHHNNNVKSGSSDEHVDVPHYRNALARVGQIKPITDSISTSSLRSDARAHLEKHRGVLSDSSENESSPSSSITGKTTTSNNEGKHKHKIAFKHKDKSYSTETSVALHFRNSEEEMDHAHAYKFLIDGENVFSFTGTEVKEGEKKHHHKYSFGIPIKKEKMDANLQADSGETKVKRHDFFSSLDARSSYWFGFVSSDGHVDHETTVIEFSLAREDADGVESFRKAIGSTNSINYSDGMAKFRFKSKKMSADLLKLGVKPKKKDRVAYKHAPAQYKRQFLRGVFEAEGTLSAEGDGQLQWGSVVEGYARWVFKEFQKISGADRNISETKLKSGKTFYKIAYNGKPASKVAKWLYKGSGPALKRKKAIARKM